MIGFNDAAQRLFADCQDGQVVEAQDLLFVFHVIEERAFCRTQGLGNVIQARRAETYAWEQFACDLLNGFLRDTRVLHFSLLACLVRFYPQVISLQRHCIAPPKILPGGLFNWWTGNYGCPLCLRVLYG